MPKPTWPPRPDGAAHLHHTSLVETAVEDLFDGLDAETAARAAALTAEAAARDQAIGAATGPLDANIYTDATSGESYKLGRWTFRVSTTGGAWPVGGTASYEAVQSGSTKRVTVTIVEAGGAIRWKEWNGSVWTSWLRGRTRVMPDNSITTGQGRDDFLLGVTMGTVNAAGGFPSGGTAIVTKTSLNQLSRQFIAGDTGEVTNWRWDSTIGGSGGWGPSYRWNRTGFPQNHRGPTDGPTTYTDGMTVFSVTGAVWTVMGGGFVIAFRANNQNNRTSQIHVDTNGVWSSRQGVSSTEWGPWKPFGSGDLDIDDVLLVTDPRYAVHDHVHEGAGHDHAGYAPLGGEGFHADRPAANADLAGAFWRSVDVEGGTVYRCNGTSWAKIAPSPAEFDDLKARVAALESA
jgi:hypothetical protein